MNETAPSAQDRQDLVADDKAGPRLAALTIIEPRNDRRLPNFSELWRFRHLIRALTERNIKLRYNNTVFGALWIMLQPLLQMGVYTLIFGLWARIPVEGVPFAVHAITGLVLLFFLNRVISESANAMRANQALIRKVYFPKLVLPVTTLGSALADLSAALLIMLAIMLIFNILPVWTILIAPFFLLMLIAWAFALSLWFAALGIRYRDVMNLVPIITMLLMYLSPVIYPVTVVPEKYLWIYALNPLAGILTGWRWAVMGLEPFHPWMVLIAAGQILTIGLTGMFYFTRTEHTFVDHI